MSEWDNKSWSAVTLGELSARLVNGGTPSTEHPTYWKGHIPWITGADFSERGIKQIRRHITDEAVNSSSTNVIDRGELLVVTRTGVGKLAVAPCKIAISQDITGFYVNRNKADTLFLYHSLKHELEELKKLNQGTSINGITRGDLVSHEVLFPPLPEQIKIAEILTTIDEVIESTEAMIAKQEKIKAGMMHDLFTRGLWTQEEIDRGDHIDTPAESTAQPGQLRPFPETAPALYKDSPLGLIPKGWDCRRLKSLLARVATPMRSGPFGSALLKDELQEKGIPLLGIDNIFVEYFKPIYRRYVSDRKFNELRKYEAFPNDVVITIMGTVGRSCVLPPNAPKALSSKHLWVMTFDSDQVDPYLMCWQLNYADWATRWFLTRSQGGIMDAIQSSTLKTLKLPVPSHEEQAIIRERYETITNNINSSNAHLAKLHQQKQGLMQDLLTGKVRVGVTDKEEAQ